MVKFIMVKFKWLNAILFMINRKELLKLIKLEFAFQAVQTDFSYIKCYSERKFHNLISQNVKLFRSHPGSMTFEHVAFAE